MLGGSSVAAQLVGCQVVLSSVKLVRQSAAQDHITLNGRMEGSSCRLTNFAFTRPEPGASYIGVRLDKL
jgi:hypothetical protein